MRDTILVTGGTGVLGARVVQRLAEGGRPVRVLSRRLRWADARVPEKAEWAVGDLAEGTGLDAALDGVGTVVHCASDPRRWKNDVTGARHLLAAARKAGSPHVLYVSIVGIDKVPFGYYRAKLEVERLVERSGLPWTVLRATQFHDLVLVIGQQVGRLPVVPVPSGVVLQPVDVGDVAVRVAELAVGEPAGRAPDLGGPAEWRLAEAVRAVLRAKGRRRPVVEVPVPGAAIRAVREGALLVPGDRMGRRGFEEFLAAAPLGDRAYGAAQRAGS
ncbi:NAD(P)H-binding protein [Streptomyces sp. RB6PN25]|uniref:NAD(P)H-binding protein n=1 Tax=Streptomyces humicola TaxID=2953240 RepID=A0ABT1Q0T1_9ACTN|nr:NAD(P)H-binding protein [Streptomyces humicola]MCQ4082973.1 NAD(P)H-binding protein [Streptomyces humicola]